MSYRSRNRSPDNPAYRPPPRSSRASESRYDSVVDRREEITTNDAPEWQTENQAPYGYDERDSRKYSRSTVAFRGAPTVAPSESISRVKTRSGRDNGREYSAGPRKASTRRPRYRSRASSDDGTAWSSARGAPLTAMNLQAFNESPRPARRNSMHYSDKSSHRASRWANNVVDENPRDWEAPAPSAHQSRAANSRQRSNTASRRSERVSEFQTDDQGPLPSRGQSSNGRYIAAGVAAGAANAYSSRSRAASGSPNEAEQHTAVSSRKHARAYSTAQEQAETTTRNVDRQVSRRTVDNRGVSPPYRPSLPTDWDDSPSPAFPATDSPDSGWEKRVYIREYRRPSDGKLVQDRECIVRKLRPSEIPPMPAAVQA